MREYCLFTDSGCDLTDELIEKCGISVIELEAFVDDKPYKLGESGTIKDFYDMLRNKSGSKTSAVNFDTIEGRFEEVLKQDKDILYIGFSSGLSATTQNAMIAANELSEKYPDNKIYIVDTLAASLGQGMLVYLAAMKKDRGADIDEVRNYLESIKLKLAHWFTVDDLFFLKRGGRVSATTALIGTALGIKPVLHVDDNGKLISISKTRGRKNSIDALFDRMKETAVPGENDTVFISHGDCHEDAQYLAERVKNELGVKEVIIGYVGPVIGAHSGPGTLALFFIADKR